MFMQGRRDSAPTAVMESRFSAGTEQACRALELVYFTSCLLSSTFLVGMAHKIYTDPLSSPPASPSAASIRLVCHCKQKLMII